MGDKSPKSKQKNQNQKKGKTAAANKEKKRVTDGKQQPKSTDKKK